MVADDIHLSRISQKEQSKFQPFIERLTGNHLTHTIRRLPRHGS
jgi:hypothetical protein